MVHDEPLRQMAALFTVYVFSILKTCSCSRYIFPFRGRQGQGWRKGEGNVSKNSHQENFHPDSPSSCSLSPLLFFFYLLNST